MKKTLIYAGVILFFAVVAYSFVPQVFSGKIVNQTAGNIYFELNGSGGLVIIPHEWINWLAPSKVLWEHRRQRLISEKNK